MRVLLMVMMVLLMGVAGCKKSSSQVDDNEPEQKKVTTIEYGNLFEGEDLNYSGEDEAALSAYNYDNVRNYIKSYNGNFNKLGKRVIKKAQYQIPSQYLKDKMEFSLLDYVSWQNKKVFVVGNDNVKVYDKVITEKDNEKEHTVANLSLGQILEVIEIVQKSNNKELSFEDVVVFHQEYNYWVKIKYNNKIGYVFGAYDANRLAISDSRSAVEVAYYLTKNEKSELFLPIAGFKKINETSQQVLKNQHFALERVDYNKDYWLSIDKPDDMLALYSGFQECQTMYITSDLLLHSLHLLFDRMLQTVETEHLYPLLNIMIYDYYISAMNLEKTAISKEIKESAKLIKKICLIASDLMGHPREDVENYPEDVKKEIAKIRSASSREKSELINGLEEDYTQYKPRGHYTKTIVLRNYFITSMFLGRMHFDIKNNDTLRTAVVFSYLATKNPDIKNAWLALNTPIEYLIGESDNITLNDFEKCFTDLSVTDVPAWISDEQNLKTLRDKIESLEKKSLIDFVTNDSSQGNGFRLLGQRFVFDSYIHSMLSTPRIGDTNKKRTMVSGADIMSVMGSKRAEEILIPEIKSLENGLKNYKELKETVGLMRDYEWRKTFYNGYLRLIKENATFTDKGFYFMQKPGWDYKALLTAHGAWAELRHDTILYAKQSSSAEFASGGQQISFSIKPYKRTVHFVEPNLDFYYWLQALVRDSQILLNANGILNEHYSNNFNKFSMIVDKLVEIVELEAQDKPISPEQNEFIEKLPQDLITILSPEGFGDWVETKDLQMALVADVHNDYNNDQVLEVATGIPYRIYVALNDGQGGKRIAIGYTYSYYEFTQPTSNRLNDDQWKEQVYSDDPKAVDDKIPAWLRRITPK